MDTTVLDAGQPQQSGLYLYAHCLRGSHGGVAVLAINADKDKAQSISLKQASERYTLTAPDLMGPAVQLSGIELKANQDGTLPAIDGRPQSAGNIQLAPASITFFAIPGANNSACK
jgi:hypothetical protein